MFINCFLNLPSISQDKCSNSTDYYLCDPSFENSALRDGSGTAPMYKSGNTKMYGEPGSRVNVNMCLGGPVADPLWEFPNHWYYSCPPYEELINGNPPPYLKWGEPDFLSWYQPTGAIEPNIGTAASIGGFSDFFSPYAPNFGSDLTMRKIQVWVPTNFASYQQPFHGISYCGVMTAFDTYGGAHKDYIQAKLKNPLLANHVYYVSFRVSHGAVATGMPLLWYQSIKRIGALFTNTPITRVDDDNILGYPQVWVNDQLQPPQQLIDSAVWMSVRGYFRVGSTDLNYITIGNFQNVADIKRDILPQITYSGKYYWGAYYYIDSINIIEEEVIQPDECGMGNHTVLIERRPPNDSSCCYSIKIISNPASWSYNVIRITKDNEQTSSEYVKPGGYIRDGSYVNLIDSVYCFTRSSNPDPVNLKIEFIEKNLQTQEILHSCELNRLIRCNCDCFDLSNYAVNGGIDEIRIVAERINNTCCFNLFIDNESNCEFPFNQVLLTYNSLNLGNLSITSLGEGWTPQTLGSSILFTRTNPSIIPTGKSLIATICVPSNGEEHNINLKIMNSESGACTPEWNTSLKCDATTESCCDNINVSLERYIGSYDPTHFDVIPKCCWNLKVSEDQVLNCPLISKMEIFNQGNLNNPIYTIDNPNFNNDYGYEFPQQLCISFPGWNENGGSLSGQLDLKVRFWVGNNIVCEKDISDSCTLCNNPHDGDSKKGDFSINKENIINLDNITIKPNPFSDKTTIEFTLDKEEFVSLEVYNSIGDRLSTLVSSSLGKGFHKQILDGESFANGAYYLKFTHGDKSVTIPIVKIK